MNQLNLPHGSIDELLMTYAAGSNKQIYDMPLVFLDESGMSFMHFW